MNRIKNTSLNKRRGSFTGFAIGTAIFLFILIVLNLFSVEIKSFFMLASLPIEKTFWRASEPISRNFSFVSKFGLLEKENTELHEENQKLLSQVIFLQSTVKTIESETSAQAVLQKNNFNFAMADVIGFDGNDEITLDKGSASGVFEGMPVVNKQGVLYGNIVKSFKNFSYVLLISSQSSVVSVKVLREVQEDSMPEIEGVVKGSGGLEVFLDLVPVNDQLCEGEVLISSALDDTFPKGLLVGRIEDVQKNDQRPHQQAKVSPFFNISTDNLFIITNYKRIE